MIMESSVLYLLSQNVSALMSILWHLLSKLLFLKCKKKKQKTIDETLIVIKDTKVRPIKRWNFIKAVFLFKSLVSRIVYEVYH